jgi:murein L,D-transpeptidase YcbB/YkuD
LATLDAFANSNPVGFMKSLPPKNPEYTRLMKAKLDMERQIAKGGWGPTVSGKSLKPGQSGKGVVELRDRLVAMGYMRRSASATYDADLQKAVQQFQLGNGLPADGVAGAVTLKEINVPMERRLRNVIVAMERERWMNRPRGKRHIDVNLADFTAKIMDGSTVTVPNPQCGGQERLGPAQPRVFRRDGIYGHQSKLVRAALDRHEGVPAAFEGKPQRGEPA